MGANDLGINSAAVVTVSGGTIKGTAGEAIDAGEFCYKKTSDGKFYLANCGDVEVAADAESDNVVGMALCSSDPSQPIKIQTSGSVTTDSVFTVGTVLYLSDVDGEVTDVYADLSADDWITTLGVPSSGTVLALDINRTAIEIP